MPRMKEDSRTLLADLTSRLERLVAAAAKEGRDEALAELRQLVAGGPAPRGGAGRPAKAAKPGRAAKRKSSGKRKNPWAGLSDEERLARVNAIRKGRGLPLKDKL